MIMRIIEGKATVSVKAGTNNIHPDEDVLPPFKIPSHVEKPAQTMARIKARLKRTTRKKR